ncbi:MAG: leucine-rich repeat domain-containing protein [Eubacterium sp.]|nr:leucine-rich repeat domain-containing protein [Eubacterium sp.]
MKTYYLIITMFLSSLLLCSCGGAASQEQRTRKDSGKTEQTEAPVRTATPKPTTETENSETTATPEPTEEPEEKDWKVVKKKRMTIQGREYTSVSYIKTKQGDIYLCSLRTDDDVLYIPSQIRGCPVVGIGKPPQLPVDSDDPDDSIFLEIDDIYDPSWNKSVKKKEKKLRKVIIQEGPKRIDEMSVNAVEILIPKSVKTIGDSSFSSSSIKKAIIKGDTIELGFCAFSNSKLEEIQFPQNYTAKIGVDCFSSTKLKSFQWPTNGTVGANAFTECKQLENVIFPENQKKIHIPGRCFAGCKKLTKLEFPASTGKVIYEENYCADNYKHGLSTLVFRGMNTKVAGVKNSELSVSSYEMPKGYTFITVKKIVAPKGSEAIRCAKKAFKISYMREWSQELENKLPETFPFTFTEDEIVPMKYEYL